MFDRKQFDARTEGLQKALQTKLNLRGKSLRARLRRAGRLLPKRLHKEGQVLLEAQEKLVHPKLAVQIDEAQVNKAFDAFEAHLKIIDPNDRRKAKLVGWAAGLVFNLLVLAVLVIALMKWQGAV